MYKQNPTDAKYAESVNAKGAIKKFPREQLCKHLGARHVAQNCKRVASTACREDDTDGLAWVCGGSRLRIRACGVR